MKQVTFSATLLVLILSWFAPAANAAGKPSELEMGLVTTQGNSSNETYNIKALTDTRIQDFDFKVSGRYLRARTQGVETARNWEYGARTEKSVSEDFAAVFGVKSESNTFAGYLQRDSADLGGRYKIDDREEQKAAVELGYRYTITQVLTSGNTFENFGRLYGEYARTLPEIGTFKYWIEFLPNFTVNSRYLVNTEASLAIPFIKNFSFKISYLVKYQNEPPGNALRTDSIFTNSLLFTF